MLSYHNDIKIKEKYIHRMMEHIAADELIRGTGYNKGKGCAVGCTLNNYDHSRYPIELGIPEWRARVEDRIFEGMSLEKSKTFPLIFLESIKPGIDLEQIKRPFLIFILESTLDKFNHIKYPEVFNSINNVIGLYIRNNVSTEEWVTANADAAADAAAADDTYAAYAAAAAAADAAADDTYAAYANADAAAGVTAYDKYADKLIELIKNCK